MSAAPAQGSAASVAKGSAALDSGRRLWHPRGMPERSTPAWNELAAAVAEAGLRPRGGFAVGPDDAVPDVTPGRPARTLLLLGGVGGSLWPAFSISPELADGGPEPLDRWSLRVVTALAGRFGARPLFPFGGPPYQPFLRWARRAEPVAPSPLGLLVHPEHGLWHSYRGALAFAAPLALPPQATHASPCESCAGKPCLTACPVGAFAPPLADGLPRYDLQGCAAHLRLPAGADCRQAGCLARRACPVAPDLAYETAQASFHMAAFLAARNRERG